MITINDKNHDRILAKLDDLEHKLELMADEAEKASSLDKKYWQNRVDKAWFKLEGAREIFAILNGNA